MSLRPTNDTLAPDGRPMNEQPKWRRDFPIDVPQDHYVARRDFTKFMVLTSFAFVAGHITIGVQPAIRTARGKPPKAVVGKVNDLPIGETRRFEYPHAGDFCVLVRLTESDFVAYDQKCTHLSCAVQPEVERDQFACPCHHGFFDLKTGRPLSGPPRRPLPRVALPIKNGTIYATGIEVST